MPHLKFWKTTITPSGRKVTRRKERKKEREITPLIVTVTVHASCSGQLITIKLTYYVVHKISPLIFVIKQEVGLQYLWGPNINQ
jgi:hypothetical protein